MTEQPRITILYPAQPGARFDFDYYVPRHLPLAVGTSLRHAAITHCDADRPVGDGGPYACLCVVGFASVAALDDFRHFFASGHPETERILADEPNYTTIKPLFVAGKARTRTLVQGFPTRTGHRVRLLFRARSGSHFDHDRFAVVTEPVLCARLRPQVVLTTSEVDQMTAGVGPGSRPDHHCIWTGWVADRAALDAFAAFWIGSAGDAVRAEIARVTDVPAEVMAAEVLTLDMTLAHAVARRGR